MKMEKTNKLLSDYSAFWKKCNDTIIEVFNEHKCHYVDFSVDDICPKVDYSNAWGCYRIPVEGISLEDDENNTILLYFADKVCRSTHSFSPIDLINILEMMEYKFSLK